MPHHFLGTFNESQWLRLKTFLSRRVKDAPGRVAHLKAEIARIGLLSSLYDENGDPVGYSVPEGSYLAKISTAYLALGGDPTHDLQVRVSSDPVYLRKEDESTIPQQLSNGEIMGGAGLADASTAELISRIKRPFQGDLRALASLERTFRRMVDYTDQLQREVEDLELYVGALEVAGSFENLVAQVEELLDDPDYPVVYRDGGKDPHGRMTHAPFASYDPGPGRPPMDQTVRSSKGVVVRGKDSP